MNLFQIYSLHHFPGDIIICTSILACMSQDYHPRNNSPKMENFHQESSITIQVLSELWETYIGQMNQIHFVDLFDIME